MNFFLFFQKQIIIEQAREKQPLNTLNRKGHENEIIRIQDCIK